MPLAVVEVTTFVAPSLARVDDQHIVAAGEHSASRAAPVRAEERPLTEAFGAEFAEYQMAVPRQFGIHTAHAP
jgi:protein-S-isoprenylcysteine O-methyltransferase Ste14